MAWSRSTRAVVGRLVAKDQDGWDVAAVVEGGVQLLRDLRLLVTVDGGQVDVGARFV